MKTDTMKTYTLMMGATLLFTFAGPASAQEGAAEGSPEADIVETAVAAGSFETLVAALEAAGLVETLQSEGPFTVFAPTDEAFAALPAGTVEELLRPENRARLTAILTYHVVPGRVAAAEVAGLDEAETVQGEELSFRVEDGTVYVGSAEIVSADIAASNGIIHVIDSVLIPSE